MGTPNDVVLTVAIALVGFAGSVTVAVAALLGIRITIRGELTRERQWITAEREHWLADLKLSGYADLIRAADDFRKAATDLRQTDGSNASEVAARAQRFEEQSHLLDRAASRVNLVGSASLQAPLHALVIHGFTSVSDILEGKADSSEEAWQQALARYYKLYDDLVNASRMDLGLESLPRPVDLDVRTA